MEQSVSGNNPVERVWQVVAKVGVCMMATRFNGGVRARPLEARPDPEENSIYFLTDVRGLKDDEIAVHPEVCLVFVDPEEKVYLSIAGAARCYSDPAKVRELWNDEQLAWWPAGPTDENVRIVRVKPEFAEYWDGPASGETARYEFALARSTGLKPNLGEERKVRVSMS
jgi:general stress protein 26